MNREDIIAMAREAGLEDEVLVPWAYEINMFAALVAAAERERAASKIEQMGIEGYGTLAIAAAIRKGDQE